MEFHESSFSIRPEGFNSIDVTSTTNKLIRAMVNSIMLFVSEIYKAIIASPPIGMNNAVRINTPPDNGLQSSFCAIWDDFSIHFAAAFENAKNRCFLIGPTSSFAFDAFSAEIRFIDFNFSSKRRLLLTKISDSFSNKSQIPINGISI